MKEDIDTSTIGCGITLMGLIFACLFIMALVHLLNKGYDTVNDTITDTEEHLGKDIIIEDDTLMIMDYSIINDNYTLEDGRKISIPLAKNLLEEQTQ